MWQTVSWLWLSTTCSLSTMVFMLKSMGITGEPVLTHLICWRVMSASIWTYKAISQRISQVSVTGSAWLPSPPMDILYYDLNTNDNSRNYKNRNYHTHCILLSYLRTQTSFHSDTPNHLMLQTINTPVTNRFVYRHYLYLYLPPLPEILCHLNHTGTSFMVYPHPSPDPSLCFLISGPDLFSLRRLPTLDCR